MALHVRICMWMCFIVERTFVGKKIISYFDNVPYKIMTNISILLNLSNILTQVTMTMK